MADEFHRKEAWLRSVSLSILTAALCSGARDPAARNQVPTYRAVSNTVLLDAVVVDKRNRVVNDLTQDDFTVYENDVPQQIQSFRTAREIQPNTAVRTEPAPSPAARRETSESVPPDAHPNFIIFLLDYSTTEFENQKLVQTAAVDFVENRLGPNDLVAVFYLGSGFRFLHGFTADRALLASILQGREVTASGLAQGSGVRPLTSAESAVVADATSIPASSGGAGAGGAQLAAGQAAAANAQVFINARLQAALVSLRTAISSRTARGVLAAIEAISRAVAPIPERKTMILFSQGFVVGPHMEPELNRAVATANRANVAIYSIDSAGLNPSELSADLVPQDRLASITARGGRSRIPATGGESLFDRARTVGNDSHESSLRYMAQATGGLAFRNTNDLSLSLERVVADIRSHYILSYQPSNQEFDGDYRKIRIELKRPGLNVRTRDGYWAIPSGVEGLTGEEYRLMHETRSGTTPSLPFDVALGSFPEAAGLNRVPVTIEIPSREVSFKDSGDTHVASLVMIGLLRGEDGRVVTRVGAPVSVRATSEELRTLQKGSLSFTNTIEVAPGRYSFEAFVRDQNSGKASTRDYGLTVPPLGSGLTASSIVLSTEVRPLEEGAQDDLLSIGKVRVLPSARRQFKNGDSLVFLFDVYNAKLSSQNRANLAVRVTLERPGAKGGIKLPVYRVEEAGSEPIPHVPVARFITLDGLAPGKYLFVAEVEDLETRQTHNSRTSFEIVPQ